MPFPGQLFRANPKLILAEAQEQMLSGNVHDVLEVFYRHKINTADIEALLQVEIDKVHSAKDASQELFTNFAILNHFAANLSSQHIDGLLAATDYQDISLQKQTLNTLTLAKLSHVQINWLYNIICNKCHTYLSDKFNGDEPIFEASLQAFVAMAPYFDEDQIFQFIDKLRQEIEKIPYERHLVTVLSELVSKLLKYLSGKSIASLFMSFRGFRRHVYQPADAEEGFMIRMQFIPYLSPDIVIKNFFP